MSGRSCTAPSRSDPVRGILHAMLFSASLFSFTPLYAADNLQSLFNFQTKMASQGNTEAMIRLGEMYEEGTGTEKSEEHAEEWYKKAHDKGDTEGQKHLERLQNKREVAAREKAAREQAEREHAAREQAAREQAAREEAERLQAAQREEAARREAARKEMTPEERARAREEAIRRAQEADQQSLQKQLEKEQAESDALKRARAASSKKR